MEKSDSIINLTCALIKAQGELEVVARDTQAYNYKYATLPAVFAEYKKCFLKYGLAVIQLVESKGLRTTLVHESGEWVSAVGDLAYTGNDPQAQGSAITYMRRYGMSAACGIMQEDDDGKKACGGKDATPPQKSEPRPHSEPVKPTEPLTATGMVKDKGKANAGGYVPFTLDNQQMDDGKDIKFTTKTQNFIDIMDNALENGNKVHITYSKTEYRGYCSIHSVIPVLKE